MKYELAIFDMDGTILDTLTDLTNSTNYALKANGFNERTREEVRTFIGDGVIELIERACPPNTDEESIKRVFYAFCDYYKVHGEDQTEPYDGIVTTLKTLKGKGVLLGVLSNKLEQAVIPLCEKYFDGIFDFVAGDKDGVRRKPYPDGILAMIERTTINKNKVVYIGDSEVDVLAGKNAGVDVISAGWGYRGRAALLSVGAKKIAERASDLVELITEEGKEKESL